MSAIFALVCVALLWGESARSQSIENVATASWQQDGQVGSVSSNIVETPVLRPAVAITTWVTANGAGDAITFRPARCLNLQGEVLRGGGEQTVSTDAVRSEGVRLGQILIIEFEEPSLNRQSSAIDEIPVVLAGTSGDREEIVVRETGPDTGIFRGSITINRFPSIAAPVRRQNIWHKFELCLAECLPRHVG